MQMGIDIDRCVSHVNDGLLCCVCRDVLEQPLQAPCEHAFCSSCIHGWLVHEHSCPEDRRTLFTSDLRPLSRYMKRDLDELKVKCINYKDGCEFVSSLERIGAHEVACEHKLIKCTNTTCKTVVQRNKLAAHLRACPGSPSSLQWTEQKPKPTVVETDGLEQLKLKLDEYRSMFDKALEEHKREVDIRLDAQRRHFVLKENGMQQQIDTLKTDNLRLREEESRLIETMNSHKQEIETLQREKKEIFEALRSLQTEVRKLRNSQPLLADADLVMSITKKKCCSGKSRMPSMETSAFVN